jgi:trehalose 6-phosphate synthase/phosphatase
MNAYPIFMTAEELKPYLNFYENILRPLFHNFKDLYDMRNESLIYWKDFCDVNKKVADKVVEVKNSINRVNQAIWIHNNHLVMVPLYVKKQCEDANIGLFFHSPFPSSAHFRINKYRFEILKSIMHCDLVAFHLFMYARNFFKTVNRLLGYELEFLRGGSFGINFHGKIVMIRVSHIGIEESFLKELTSTKKFSTMEKLFQNAMKPIFMSMKQNTKASNSKDKKFERPLVMGSIDSYHPISGLKNKLLSFKLFLQQYPTY